MILIRSFGTPQTLLHTHLGSGYVEAESVRSYNEGLSLQPCITWHVHPTMSQGMLASSGAPWVVQVWPNRDPLKGLASTPDNRIIQ